MYYRSVDMENLANYKTCKTPGQVDLTGNYVRLEVLNWDTHGAGLERAVLGAKNDDLWTHMPIGPFADLASYQMVLEFIKKDRAWQTLVIISQSTNAVLGAASYMRIREQYGSCEVGAVTFGKALQKTREASEAMYLMARHVFDDLGYRRYEWKCDNDNAASKRAAHRLGFSYEGLFRKDLIVKGRNRDTAWFSITDDEWPTLWAKFQTWLSPDNFDGQGQQLRKLEAC